jgi:hypothetical protein
MARKSQLTNVLLNYIARDDSAIGVAEEELDTVYDEYMRTKDMSVLKIDHDKRPCIYTLRTFSTQKHNTFVTKAVESLRDVMKKGEEEGGMEKLDFQELARAWDDYDLYAGMAIRDRIIGVTNHPLVSEITDHGELREVIIQWTPGQSEPAGLLDDILAQKSLVREIFQFLVIAASLTERQKKA